MSTLYLECYSGISGDMTVASLLDLGAEQTVLENAIDSLNLDGFKIDISRTKKAGLDTCDFNVILDKSHENHDHDMEYLHGHNHGEHKNHHSHEHRGLPEILDIIESADITNRAKSIANRIFSIIAEAESKAHGVELNQVHFHEVGAIDSIVDIISVAVCLDNLNVTEVIVPKLFEGYGSVRCQHGIIPIPVPAVTHIAQKYNLQLHITDTEGELVTPTGAAIVAAIRTSDKLPDRFQIKKIGIGAGKRDYNRPSILRAMLIQPLDDCKIDMYKLESNIDDCSGEVLGYTMEKLFKAGAKDVNYIPIFMKKNRPAYQLNVICEYSDIEKLEQIIFKNTTTIGIRRIKIERTVLERENKKILTSFGEVDIKICKLQDGTRKFYPEYNSIIEICERDNLCYLDVYNKILTEIKQIL